MMVFKIVMTFVFWKASLDFAAIIDERSNIFNFK
jgi:regulatory protein YycH of two-component signal transduction system YycFG